jgi:dolichol-phosphate mannosyltransferase
MAFPVILDVFRGLSTPGNGNFFAQPGRRLAIVFSLGMGVDLAIFSLLLFLGIPSQHSHLFSLGAVAIFNYLLLFWRAPADRRGLIGGWNAKLIQIGLFWAVSLMGLFLRGGVLATFTELFDWAPRLAILPAVAAAGIVNFLGSFFWIFPARGTTQKLRWEVAALAVVTYMVLLRNFYSGILELIPQEAYYWKYAQHLDIGYLDHPPVVSLLIWLGTHLLGNTEMGVRIGAFGCWIITAIFCFRRAYNLFDKTTGIGTLLLLAVLPFFFGVGIVMTPDAPLVACWAGALYFLERSLVGQKRSAWWAVGVCIGLGMLSKYTIALLCPSILLFICLDRHSRHWLKKPEPFLAASIALLLFLPVIVWNVEHDWASFIFQGSRRFRDSLEFTLPALIGSVLLLLTPTGALGALAAVFGGRRRSMVRDDTVPAGEGRKHLFALVFTLFPLLVFLVFSLGREAKLNWTGPIWLAALPFIARQIVPAAASAPDRLVRFLQRTWPPTLILLVLFWGALMHYLALGFPGVPYPQAGDLGAMIGWKDLGNQIEAIEDNIEKEIGVEPFVVGMDKNKIASELAFYRQRQGSQGEDRRNEAVWKTIGRHIFGMESLMYSYWFPENLQIGLQKKGQVLILVTRELQEIDRDRIGSKGWEIGEIKQLELKKNDVPVGVYYYTIAKYSGEGATVESERDKQ